MRWRRFSSWLVAVMIVAATPTLASTTELIHVNSLGCPASGGAAGPPPAKVTPDGRYVLFSSLAQNLVAGDSNLEPDVFVRDRRNGTTELVSVAGHEQANAFCQGIDITADGRYVSFISKATNLVPGATGDKLLYVRDREDHTTEIISLNHMGEVPNGHSEGGKMSPDGRYIVFTSYASDVAPGDLNGAADCFLVDRGSRAVEVISVSTSGEWGNAESGGGFISDDGRFVLFDSLASNLAPGTSGTRWNSYLRDRVANTTELLVTDTSGGEPNGITFVMDVSSDWRYLLVKSTATDLVPDDPGADDMNLFVVDRVGGTVEMLDLPLREFHIAPSMSGDGRWICFGSPANALVTGDTNGAPDVFLYDRDSNTVARVSLNSAGEEANGESWNGSISDDGRYILFHSLASNLFAGDWNDTTDIFLIDREGDGPFDDVPAIYWAAAETEACSAAGVVQGYGERCYAPKSPVNRDQMAVYLARVLAGGDEYVEVPLGVSTFPDVPETCWAYRHVEYAAERNIVTGYEDGSYHPGFSVDRAQMAAYIARSLVDPMGEEGMTGYVPADPRDFPDVPGGSWAWSHIEYCVEAGIVQGYEDGSYHPGDIVTRDQMAVYITRAFELTD